jgi:hypothetical protein
VQRISYFNYYHLLYSVKSISSFVSKSVALTPIPIPFGVKLNVQRPPIAVDSPGTFFFCFFFHFSNFSI